MPLGASPARRVLGEKDANASLNISSPHKTHKTSAHSHSLASAQMQSKVLAGAIDAVSASPRTGQKRRITEVEGVEARDWDEEVRASQGTDAVSDSASEADQVNTSMMSARSAADTTMTSFGIGVNEESQVDQQFELLEPEMSQRTLDKIHAVTLPQNTSQPSQLRERPGLVKDASQDSLGMSTFLNFHSDPSSQASDGMRMIEPTLVQSDGRQGQVEEDTQGSRPDLSEEDRRKALMEEKAAQLRTRLQLAFFKVETRQTHTPFSRLKVPKSHRRKWSSPPSLLPPTTSLHQPQSHSISIAPTETPSLGSEGYIAAMRAQATTQHKPAVKSLSSLPIPHIMPTAFSARWTDDQPSAHTHVVAQHLPPQNDKTSAQGLVDLPSSPPLSNHSLHIHEDDTATRTVHRSRTASPELLSGSPTLPAPTTPASKDQANEQLSSPPPSQGEDEDCVVDSDGEARPSSKDKNQPRERRLTSSVVKGEAASGLLQLMRGVVNVENVRGPMCGL